MEEGFWSKDYEIIPSLDEQHKQLFEFVEAIKRASADGADPVRISQVVQSMLDYGIGHFRYEESMLRETGYPYARIHANHHRDLMVEVMAYLTRYTEEPSTLPELIEFLESWLHYHILIEDQGFKEHLIGRGKQ